jgi:phosphatidate cytidylyltransferase
MPQKREGTRLCCMSHGIGSPREQSIEQRQRVLSALVILPPLVAFLMYAPAGLFLLLVMGLIAVCLHEYWALLVPSRLPAGGKMGYLVAFWLAGVAHIGGARWLPLALFLGLVVLTVEVIVRAKEVSHFLPMLAYSIFGVLFIGWSLSHLVLLRSLSAGQWYVLCLCVIVWVGDSMAMYTGKLWGRHKLAPLLSPGKTWEGAAGGIVGGVLAAVLGAHFLLPPLALWSQVVLGLLVVVASQISDLGESMLKRYVGVKDSGELIPGHGGLLDRLDSLLFAAPTLVYALAVLGAVSAEGVSPW